MDNAIRNAKTKATQALEQVKDWFQQPRPLASSVTTFRRAYRYQFASGQKKMHRDFSPEVERNIQQHPSFVQLQRFTDIFIILFDNIWRHSGNQTAPKVRIKARLVDKNLRIEFRNSVEKGVRSSTVEKRVATIQQKIAQGSYQPAVTTEGGTGLMKIHNIAASDRDGASALEFYFESDDWFFVGLTFL